MQLRTETGLGRVSELHKYLETKRCIFVASAHNWIHGNGDLTKMGMRRMPRTDSRKTAVFKVLLKKETEQKQQQASTLLLNTVISFYVTVLIIM